MEVIPQSSSIGALVRGLDLSGDLSDELIEKVNQAFLDYQILFFAISFRLHWQQNTLAMWDNRCTQHYALNDYHGHRRVMHRIVVEGERPE